MAQIYESRRAGVKLYPKSRLDIGIKLKLTNTF